MFEREVFLRDKKGKYTVFEIKHDAQDRFTNS